jgi:hypothetical protein
VEAVSVPLTPAQARAMGIDVPAARKQRSTRKAVPTDGQYHTRCRCGEEFRTMASEDRHVALGHNRFTIVLEVT